MTGFGLVAWRKEKKNNSFDDEVLDGHSNEDGGEGEQGDDEEGELLVCEAASRLVALGSFRSCTAG